jgi:hypothetical protein
MKRRSLVRIFPHSLVWTCLEFSLFLCGHVKKKKKKTSDCEKKKERENKKKMRPFENLVADSRLCAITMIRYYLTLKERPQLKWKQNREECDIISFLQKFVLYFA